MKHKELIAKLYRENNYSRKKVIEKSGLTWYRVNYVLSNSPELLEESRQYRIGKAQDRNAKIVELLKEGKSLNYICNKLDVDKSRIYKLRQEHNLIPNSNKKVNNKPKHYVPFWPY